MKHLILAALILGGSALAAHAETFTFTGTGTESNAISVAAPGGGGSVTAVFTSGNGQTIMASGKALATSSTCEEHSALPGGIFEQLGECNYTDSSGTGSILYGCNPTKAPMEANCVGGIWGTAGAYAGRSGTISWHAKPSADGKSGEFAGAGQWGN